MNPLIKWPGGKSGEIDKIEPFIPKYNRYIEPFFGGGALFFHLKPQLAAINDISQSLIDYYRLIQTQDEDLKGLLMNYCTSFDNLLRICDENYNDILKIYDHLYTKTVNKETVQREISVLVKDITSLLGSDFRNVLLLDEEEFKYHIVKMVSDKMARTISNNIKHPFTEADLKSNLITGFTSGYYMYFRKVYNDLNLGRMPIPSIQYKVANFYFIREYCYGSMFRYNARGEFNIPYGGISYNSKNFKSKIENMFNNDVRNILSNTAIFCSDFESFFRSANLSSEDFMFLDPPYDTDFSDYEGKDFTQNDQERLADTLKKTPAKFLLVIKNTDFIRGLYEKEFNILSFDNQYTYNVRSRNERKVEHLIITNLPV